MKINKKDYPVLDYLKSDTFGKFPIYQEDRSFFDVYGGHYRNLWTMKRKIFNKKIYVISNSFIKASLKSWDKLSDLFKDYTVNDSNDLDVKGTFIIGEFVYMIDYSIKKGIEHQKVTLFVFTKEGTPIYFYVDDIDVSKGMLAWVTMMFKEHNRTTNEINSNIYTTLVTPIFYHLFSQYAEVETKILPPKTKSGEIICKYNNQTDFNLNFLDSKWFTNLVQSDGFNVSGHFRLQPKKHNGKWTRELIWINEFTKNGYTSKAKITQI